MPRGVPVTTVRPVYPRQQQCSQALTAGAGGGHVLVSPPSPTSPSPWPPRPGTWTCQDWPRPFPPPSVRVIFSAHLPLPLPRSRLLFVRLRPEQPLRALARVGAAASISLLNYAGAAVGRSTLAGTRLRRGAGMGGAGGGGGGGGEEGFCGQRLLGPRPAGPALPSCGFWWAVESQALPEEGIVRPWVPGCSHPRIGSVVL